jgi:arsenical pump membrane protein
VPATISSAISQTWPAFALVAGLLLIGSVAASDGVFEAIGTRLARLPGDGVVLLCSMLTVVVVVTVVLNLDTSVVFLTPIALHAARSRGVDERAFLYGTVLMSNSASLLLPGSNLTNLLVLGGDHVSGLTFAARMLPAFFAAVVVTAAVLVSWRWRDLRRNRSAGTGVAPLSQFRIGAGLVAILTATVLVLVLADPALPVLGLGVAAASSQVALRRLPVGAAVRALNIPLLLGVFVLAVGLGAVARVWGAPGKLVHSLGSWQTAGLAAGASVIVNNLPAAMLLASTTPAHPRALLLGLNLGPNLALTGSLSAVLWMRVALATGSKPSALTFSRLGLVVVPCTIAAGLAALTVFSPTGLPL